jgi:hypothetical protein
LVWLAGASGWYEADRKAGRWTGPRSRKTAASAAAPRTASAGSPGIDRTDRTDRSDRSDSFATAGNGARRDRGSWGGGFRLRGQRSPPFAPRTCVTAFDRCGLCGLVGFCGLAKKKERGAQVFRQSDSGICRSLKIADPGRFSLLGCLGHTGDFGVLRLGGFLATALVYPAPTPPAPLNNGGEDGASERVARWGYRAGGKATALVYPAPTPPGPPLTNPDI